MRHAGYGRAVLDLVDTALDALASADTDDTQAFTCGGTRVRIRGSGARGHEYPPFSHLPSTSVRAGAAPLGAPELVVHVRDGHLPGGAGRPPAGFHRVRDERTFVSVTDDPPTVDALRSSDRTAISWIGEAASAPPYVRFRPFAEIFSAWYPTQGMVLLHAAAVGDADGAVLLVGDGGSGKSTTAVLCSNAGLGFLADDFCLLEPGAPPRVHSIYRSAKLRRDSAQRLPDVDATPDDIVDGDHYFLVDESDCIVSAPVRAIVATRPLPDLGATPHLERVPEPEVLPLLVPTALKVTSGGEAGYRNWLRAAHTLAHTVTTSILDLTWDTDRVVELVDDALHLGRTVRS